MSGNQSRRAVIKGAGATVTAGMLAAAFGAALAKRARAAEGAKPGDCMTILYPGGPGVTFNADYYRDHHLTLIMKLYGSSIHRYEMRKVVPPSPGAPPPPGGATPPFAAAINIWIADLAAFNENNRRHAATLVKDVPNFTNANPTFQYDKIHGTMGASRSDMKIGDTCLTILYPNGDDVRWDVDYYRTHHMPLIMRLYGKEAIKRFELRKGDAAGPGGKPPYIGTVNIYINDQKAFDAAGAQHGKTLVEDVPHFSSVLPMAFPTVIHGIG